MTERYAGILMPVTSLPSPYGVGTFGAKAREFIDFLVKAGQRIWQVLPLVPTGYGDSPYSSSCATAGSPYMIDIDGLIEEGLLTADEAAEYSCATDGDLRVNYAALFQRRIPLLKIAFSRFDRENADFREFVERGEYADFSAFMTLKEAQDQKPLSAWDKRYRTRGAEAEEFLSSHGEEVLFWQFTQYEFFRQWHALKEYANARGVLIMGDMPLYVSADSAEMWAKPELFLLDENGAPTEVAGVPPDYFSETGQLWGNPLYNWEKMKEDGYSWWTARLKKALATYDLVRIDHFRGFDRFYAVPAGSSNAKNGRWLDGPKEALFEDKREWKIVAEDLGLLDEGVYRLIRNTGYPRMKVLEFAFDGNPDHEFKPSNYDENCVAYTGTHDNATFIEYLEEMDGARRAEVYRDIASECERSGVKFSFDPQKIDRKATMQRAREAVIEAAYVSRAKYVILPLQDLLGAGAEARINSPGVLGAKNWSWRVDDGALSDKLARKIRKTAKKGNRI